MIIDGQTCKVIEGFEKATGVLGIEGKILKIRGEVGGIGAYLVEVPGNNGGTFTTWIQRSWLVRVDKEEADRANGQEAVS